MRSHIVFFKVSHRHTYHVLSSSLKDFDPLLPNQVNKRHFVLRVHSVVSKFAVMVDWRFVTVISKTSHLELLLCFIHASISWLLFYMRKGQLWKFNYQRGADNDKYLL